MKATVGLGSNLGDRLANLQFAIDSLNATVGTQVHCISPVYETDPVGGPAQDDYLNAVVVLKTILFCWGFKLLLFLFCFRRGKLAPSTAMAQKNREAD